MMKRDGLQQSCWQHMPDRPSAGHFNENTVYDVLIVGGGITGLTTALLLQQAGKQCVLTEAFSIGYGTTGGTTAHLNTFLDLPYTAIGRKFGEEGARQVHTATSSAIEQIRQLIATHSIRCGFSEMTGYVYATNEEQDAGLEKIVDASSKAGMTIHYINESILAIPYSTIAQFTGQAQFHPVQYLYGLAKAFEGAGGILVQDNPVQKAEIQDNVEAHTPRGTIRAKHVVYATHTPPGISVLHTRLIPTRSYALAVRLKDQAALPNGLVYDMEEPFHYFRTQEIEGVNYLIVGGEDHKTGHEENTGMPFRRLESYVRKYFEIEEVTWKWSSQFYEPVDGLPYIGRMPMQLDNVFVATGFSGNGMVYGTLAGMMLTDMILTGSSPYEKLFSPSRFKPVAGFTEFVKENVGVAAKFFTGPFSGEKIETMVQLARGEGKLIDYEGRNLALYKDEEGRLHALDPLCTHLGCTVSWNSAERSWDCPCHGSRFNIDGETITGPAVEHLKRVQVEQQIRQPH